MNECGFISTPMRIHYAIWNSATKLFSPKITGLAVAVAAGRPHQVNHNPHPPEAHTKLE
jgi:hypothetical protein